MRMVRVTTPDGRYFVHRERLWRCSDPNLPAAVRTALVGELMQARRAVKAALASGDGDALRTARAQVHAAKVALGERGPTWWGDDVDHNRRLVRDTPYAAWWRAESAGT